MLILGLINEFFYYETKKYLFISFLFLLINNFINTLFKDVVTPCFSSEIKNAHHISHSINNPSVDKWKDRDGSVKPKESTRKIALDKGKVDFIINTLSLKVKIEEIYKSFHTASS